MGWAGNTYEVSTPGSISKTAIQDECTLQKIEGNKVTFDLIIRSHTAIDQDFARYMVKLNGKMIAPIIKEQSMEVRDYAYTGEYTVAAMRTITGAGTFDLNITKPEEYIFRVIERKITVVGVVEAMSDEISIDISIPVEWNTARLGEVFKFKMM